MMNRKELMEQLCNCKSNEEIADFIAFLCEQYEAMNPTEEDMIELTEFMFNFSAMVGPDFVQEVLNEAGYIPKLFADTSDFVERYNEIQYENLIGKMSEYEKEEANLLFEAIWNKNVRTEIQSEFYDWDLDEDRHSEMALPRDGREELGLRKICAEMIYNRGSMFIRFYVKRGMFEIAGVKAFNGTGEWSCLSEYEMMDIADVSENEKIILLPHEKNRCTRLVFPS